MLVHSEFICESLAFSLELSPPQFQSAFAKEPKSFSSVFTRSEVWRVMKVKVAQSCPTLCNSMFYTVHGILQARILEWVAFPFFRRSSQSRVWTQVSCIAGSFFFFFKPSEAPGKSMNAGVGRLSLLQWIFLTQKLNWGLLHCGKVLYQLSDQRIPDMLYHSLIYICLTNNDTVL